MAGAFGITGKNAQLWLHLWVLGAAVLKPVFSAPADDPRCSPSGFTLAYPSTPAWISATTAGTSTDGFNMQVDIPSRGYTVGETAKVIWGGKWPVHVLTGPDATSITPQAVGFDFTSAIDLRTVTAVGLSTITTGDTQSFVTGVVVFPDFPAPGANSTISYAGHTSTTENAVTGGTNAFMGITGEIVTTYSGQTQLGSVRYANGFKPVC